MGMQPVMVQLAVGWRCCSAPVARPRPGVLCGVRLARLPAPVPGRALDLAAMALTPLDLDDIGLTGFGQQTSAFLTLEEQAEHLRAGPRSDSAAVRAALAARLGASLPAQLGLAALSSRLRTFVAPYVIEYASVKEPRRDSPSSRPSPRVDERMCREPASSAIAPRSRASGAPLTAASRTGRWT